MKNLRGLFIVTIMVWVMVLMIGCAMSNFNKRSYQILKTSQTAYDLATDSIIDMHKKGLISQADYKKIEYKADVYAEAHNKAVAAMKAFNMGMITAEQTGDKMVAVSVALTELLKVAQPYILKLDKED